jgi:hypothetical protein
VIDGGGKKETWVQGHALSESYKQIAPVNSQAFRAHDLGDPAGHIWLKNV